MKLHFKTKVKGYYKDLIEKFDQDLFEALAPEGGGLEVIEFTGSKKGDHVHLRFTKPLKAEWISDITDDGVDDKKAYFVDEGRVLPFGLKYWKHEHIIEKIDDNYSYIVDVIEYRGVFGLWSLLLYPGLYVGFAPRGKIYKKYFGT